MALKGRLRLKWDVDFEDLGEALQSLIGQPRLVLEQVRRRLPFRRRIGLVLSGGGERGFAHIGVLSVLEREGIIPDVVAGTSAGAVVGAVYCAGWSTRQMLQLAAGLNWTRLGKPRWNLLRSMGILDGARFEEYFRELVGDITFEDLAIPLTVMAADLLTGEEVPIRSGPLAPAVRASSALPVIFNPVPYNGRLLVDGGLVNNLPITSALEMGADYVIAVNVSQATEPTEPPENILDVLQLAFVTMRRNAMRDEPAADCLIVPRIGDTDKLRLTSGMGRIYQAGVLAAEAALPQLRKDLGLS
jgi:NTE family protein